MKVKFLVPEIDRKRWSETFSKKMKLFSLDDNDLTDIGLAPLLRQSIYDYRHMDRIPYLDTFLTICCFFGMHPEEFLFAKPKWIECDVKDISKFSLLGKVEETYYVAPREVCDFYNRTFDRTFNENLLKEPDPLFFSNFQLSRPFTYTRQQRLPSIDIDKTDLKIEELLNDSSLYTIKTLTKLLGYPQEESARRLINHKQNWAGKHPDNLFKLSWILDKRFEELLVINYNEPDKESQTKCAIDNGLFSHDILSFLEHYVSDDYEEWYLPDDYE